jgi:hypothetical protein
MICGYCDDREHFWICGSGCDGLTLLLAYAYPKVHVEQRCVYFKAY